MSSIFCAQAGKPSLPAGGEADRGGPGGDSDGKDKGVGVVLAAPSVTVTWGRQSSVHRPDFFAVRGTVSEQMSRVLQDRENRPAATELMMRHGERSVRLSRDGQLQELERVVSECPRGEKMLTWFSVRMFEQACINNRLQIMRYMVSHGLDIGFPAVLDAVHWVVGGCDEHLGGRDVVPTLDFLVSEVGMPVSAQRRSDFRTPLHVAVQRGLFEASLRLIELGADINAVAKEDVMPLNLAEQDTHPGPEAATHRDNASAKDTCTGRATASVTATAPSTARATGKTTATGSDTAIGTGTGAAEDTEADAATETGTSAATKEHAGTGEGASETATFLADETDHANGAAAAAAAAAATAAAAAAAAAEESHHAFQAAEKNRGAGKIKEFPCQRSTAKTACAGDYRQVMAGEGAGVKVKEAGARAKAGIAMVGGREKAGAAAVAAAAAAATENRARICKVLVERGARRTWRRGPSERQVSLDKKYADLMKGGDGDGRTFCTYNG